MKQDQKELDKIKNSSAKKESARFAISYWTLVPSKIECSCSLSQLSHIEIFIEEAVMTGIIDFRDANRIQYIWVEPWSPYHFSGKVFFSISFVVKMPVWSEKHFWSQKKGTLL